VGSEGSAGTAMLGLPGFVLLAVSQVAGELEQAVESTACEVFCPACGVLAKPHLTAGHADLGQTGVALP
jgi:hypothetical protein